MTELRISDDRFRDYDNKLDFIDLDGEVKRKGFDPVVKLSDYMQNTHIEPVFVYELGTFTGLRRSEVMNPSYSFLLTTHSR